MSRAVRKRNQRRGILAEYLAAGFLMLKGYRLLAMRYKTKWGEVDLIMRYRGQLIFVEVKARRTHDAAAYAVHEKNQARVMAAANAFLAQHAAYTHYQVRFDVVLVAWYKRPHHLAHAFAAAI